MLVYGLKLSVVGKFPFPALLIQAPRQFLSGQSGLSPSAIRAAFLT